MLRAISIKTQARRLAIISNILDSTGRKGLPKELLNNKMISWAEKNQIHFSVSPYNSGELKKGVESRISNSFKNYLETCFQLNLIDEISNLISPSNYGKVLKIFLNRLNQDPYPLSQSEKIFYLFIILRYDADIILTIISMVNEFPGRKLIFYLEIFKDTYYKRLAQKVETSTGKNKQIISEALARVRNWQSPKRYSEDIIPPRLNWMIDLEIIDITYFTSKSLFRLSDFGHHYINTIPRLEGLYDVSEEWFSKHFLSSFLIDNDQIVIWENVLESKKDQVLGELLKESLSQFSTLELPRIPLDSSLLYIAINLFTTYNILANANSIESFIGFDRKIEGITYGIRRSARSYESYILVKDVI